MHTRPTLDCPTLPPVTLPPPTWRDICAPLSCAPVSNAQWVRAMDEHLDRAWLAAHAELVARAYCLGFTPSEAAFWLRTCHAAPYLAPVDLPAWLCHGAPPVATV